ncbi:MAG: VWA domain-containing protein, partial [Myxococcota bacterium]|nr:VWA domain-containing protein [Myxococcota bacterium]
MFRQFNHRGVYGHGGIAGLAMLGLVSCLPESTSTGGMSTSMGTEAGRVSAPTSAGLSTARQSTETGGRTAGTQLAGGVTADDTVGRSTAGHSQASGGVEMAAKGGEPGGSATNSMMQDNNVFSGGRRGNDVFSGGTLGNDGFPGGTLGNDGVSGGTLGNDGFSGGALGNDGLPGGSLDNDGFSGGSLGNASGGSTNAAPGDAGGAVTDMSIGDESTGGTRVVRPGPGGSSMDDGVPVGGVESAIDPPCLAIDRINGPTIFPPAGVRVGFRLLDCQGRAVRPLRDADISIIDDEQGRPFGEGGEGGGVSGIGAPSEIGLYTVLALDLSDSIFNADALNDVIEGARTFVNRRVTSQPAKLKHHVMILAFGRTAEIEVIQDFTQDDAILNTGLDRLANGQSRGSTDLYNAYLQAVEHVNRQGSENVLVERFVVILTDGTHQAGDEANLRNRALAARLNTDASIYSVAIRGDFDEAKLRELASRPETYLAVDNANALGTAFGRISEDVEALAASNYVVGVCTPVTLGMPTLTIRVRMGDAMVEQAVSYPVDQLDGNLRGCDPVLISGDYERICVANTIACVDNDVVACDAWGANAQRTECGALPGVCIDARCVATVCGDNRIDPTEPCDDGNRIDTDACTNDCTVARCGDGIVRRDQMPGRETYEACDDGNQNNLDACTNACREATCDDSLKNLSETDVDCGGPQCAQCPDLKTCNNSTDCQSGVCEAGLCQVPTCSDMVQNGRETGTDCGSDCPACPAGTPCAVANDCQSAVCSAGRCAQPTCSDNVKNGDETGQDCGGSCTPCPAGALCTIANDCTSAVCTNGVCQAPNCNDGVVNGFESDQDCGGDCPGCADQRWCNDDSDCTSLVCREQVVGGVAAMLCQAPRCDDNVHNGDETDVVCGGPCSPCETDARCQMNDDCRSDRCVANRCALPPCDRPADPVTTAFSQDVYTSINDGLNWLIAQGAFDDNTAGEAAGLVALA